MDEIHVIEFETIYKPQSDGTVKEVDICRYCAKGARNFAINEETVSSLSKVLPLAGNEDNPAIVMANHRWDVIGSRYKAWKSGQEIPEDGTPLGAWPAINQNVAEMLKNQGIRTVEDFANGSDNLIARLNVPNARELKNIAIKYIESRGDVEIANRLKQKDEQVSNLESELEEMKKMIAELSAKPKAPRAKKASA